GEIMVNFPDLNIETNGSNDEEALNAAKEVLGMTMFGLEKDGEMIPSPTSFTSILPEENQRVVMVNVSMPVVRRNLKKRGFTV
nr:type II toxin-antitoxin system HicB family antitoxin [Eubacterium sp.]